MFKMKRMILIAVGSMLLIGSASAQQPAEYMLRVTPTELDLISEGLGTQPFTKVVPLINKLRSQVVEQQTPAKPVENKPVDNKEPEKK
jgi:hypothetical protein